MIWFSEVLPAIEPISLESLGTVSAIIMFLGYCTYAAYLVNNKTEANATTWILTSIGSATLFVSEFLYGVPWNALKTDAVDTIAAVCIAAVALSIGNFTPWTKRDKKIAGWFLLLFAIYLLGDYLQRAYTFEGVIVLVLTAGVIILYNITTILEFLPILRETWKTPEKELPWAWYIWTISYLLYLLVRIGEQVPIVALINPILSVGIHFLMVLISFPLIRALGRSMYADTHPTSTK